jgi:rhodanese-related sulfurtransferase
MGLAMMTVRMTPAKAKALIEGGQAVVIDLTSAWVDPAVRGRIPGAIHISPDLILDYNRRSAEILRSLPEIPRDRTVIAYCTCPGEEASARLAEILRSDGYDAWALEGGLPAWRAAGFPMEPNRATA